MKQLLIPIFIIFCSLHSVAQEEKSGSNVIDSLYREDQIYLGLSFHILDDLPEGVSQSGFSGGIALGFIRDFPLNKRRNIAIGAGLGWSVNVYNQELFIDQVEGQTIFRNLAEDEVVFDVNRFSTQLVELPLEFRWRTSTPQTYKFWRVYGGLRLGYMYRFKSSFRAVGLENVVVRDPLELQRFRVGSTLSFGYGTFNFHVYYGLNSFFEDAVLEDDVSVDITPLKLGLMFYIL